MQSAARIVGTALLVLTIAPPMQGSTTSRPATAVSHHPAPAKPLAGTVVGVDPGHNGRNYTDPRYLDRQVWNGREYENCNTTGTSTDSGYTEARFNFRVATFLRRGLAGLNLTTVPLVLIESGNMRNAKDSSLMHTTKFQRHLATAFARAITTFVLRSGR